MKSGLQPAGNFPDILRDESRSRGHADFVAWPVSISEAAEVIRHAAEQNLPVTFQGARTGITGGAVPDGGIVVNLARLDQIGPVRRDTPHGPLVRVQAGFPLDPLQRAIARETPDLFFAPDPTETSASIGGMAACNASGARSFSFGSIRRHIHAISVILADGSLVRLERGRDRAHGRDFQLATPAGRTVVEGVLPEYRLPQVKNVAGYHVAPDMDMLDLFIGSDGTLGAIVSLDLKLLPVPQICWALMVFDSSPQKILDLADLMRRAQNRPAALEFFDNATLELLRTRAAEERRIPAPPPGAEAALYIELLADSEAEGENKLEEVTEAVESAGLSADDAWFATMEKELKKFREFRHAVPEAVNSRIDELRRAQPELTKIGTDFSLPPQHFRSFLMRQYAESKEAGLEHVAFGHIGDCHIHMNLLPGTAEKRETAWKLFRNWAQVVSELGGSVAAEHGIGKLKSDLLPVLYGDKAVAAMRHLKQQLDPDERLGRGSWFPPL